MLVSLSWLKEFLSVDIDPHDLALKLTMAGIEADVVDEEWGAGWQDVVVARVIAIKPFPGKEDRLLTGKIDVGGRELEIVSADLTLREGELVLAVEGGKFFNGRRIEKRKFGEFLSEAMLVAGEELGWEEKSERLLRFSDDREPGTRLVDIIDVPDAIIELEITPNRGDCLSHLGVARELKAILGIDTPVRIPDASIEEVEPPSSKMLKVFVDSPDMGPYYTGRYISGVTVRESPLFIQSRLARVGIRSISNVVDITNYVLMELGQPLHAFDSARVSGGEIHVRAAKRGEKILLLDGTERELTEKDLVIADRERPIALAGIMGGEESGVNEETSEVILESAFFTPVTIRHTARRLGIQTDASYRFERGVDPLMIDFASDRASHLIQLHAGGKVHTGLVIGGENPYRERKIALSYEKQNRVIGLEIPSGNSVTILKNLGCAVDDREEYMEVVPPSWRYDLERDVDLIEEVARIYGYNEIPTTYPTIRVKDFSPEALMMQVMKPRTLLPQWGFTEVINYSFVSPDMIRSMGFEEGDRRLNWIEIINPLTVDQSVMRTTLLPGLLENIRTNLSMQFTDLRLFEIGKVYWREGEEFREEFHLSLVMTGNRYLPHWGWGREKVDFYDLKGVTEAILDRFHIEDVEWRESLEPFFHPYQQSELISGGVSLGRIGQVHPAILESRKIKQPVFYGELYIERLLELSGRVKYESVSKFPAAERDLAVLVDEDVPAGKILEVAGKVAGKLAWDIRVFDLYRGDKIPQGKKSIGIRFYLQHPEHTLSEEEISELMDRVVTELKKIGGELRS